MIRFIPLVPVPKSRPRFSNGHAYTPRRTAEYEKGIADATADMRFSGAVSLQVGFFMPIPKSWSQKKKTEKCGKPHTSKPDTDNLLKALLDGMSGCWWDDSIVFDVRAVKLYGAVPGVLLNVEEVENEK